VDVLAKFWCGSEVCMVEEMLWWLVLQTVEELMSSYPYFSVMLREVAMDRLGMYGMRELVSSHVDTQGSTLVGSATLLGSGSLGDMGTVQVPGVRTRNRRESVRFVGNPLVKQPSDLRDPSMDELGCVRCLSWCLLPKLMGLCDVFRACRWCC
jgi:hypothetical protein